MPAISHGGEKVKYAYFDFVDVPGVGAFREDGRGEEEVQDWGRKWEWNWERWGGERGRGGKGTRRAAKGRKG